MSQGAVTFLYTGNDNSVQKTQHLVTQQSDFIFIIHLQVTSTFNSINTNKTTQQFFILGSVGWHKMKMSFKPFTKYERTCMNKKFVFHLQMQTICITYNTLHM